MSMSAMTAVAPFRAAAEDARADAAREDGYLYLPGLLPADEVLAVREQVAAVAARHGLLRAGTPARDAVAEQSAFLHESDPTPEYRACYNDLLRLRAMHALAVHPALIGALETVLGEPVLAHPRNIVRMVVPGRPSITTAPHQDHRPIKGTPEVWTAWLPLGDCPERLGGLAVLPGSHRNGLYEVPDGTIYFDTADVRTVGNGEWRWNPMRCGDVLLFHSLTVHQARDNRSRDRIRLSCDFRYQARSQPVHEHSLLPHMRWIDWGEIYAGWAKDDPLRYYWRAYRLDVRSDDRLSG